MTEVSDPPAYAPFSYATAPNAELYRRVMHAFVRAKERFTVHLRPEDVGSALQDDGGGPVPVDVVTSALDQLASPGWGNLVAFPDSSRVTAIEDFYRRRMLYQLSRAGEAAERALRVYDESLGSRGALQAVALEDIAILLRSLRRSLAEDDAPAVPGAEDDAPAVPGAEDRDEDRGARDGVDEARIHQDLRSLRDRFTELADNAVVFMGSVQRSIDLQDADLDAFLAYKERLIEYLERFIADLVTRSAQISAILSEFTAAELQHMCTIAARRESLDAAPGQLTDEEAGERVRDLTHTWLRRWQGLSDWFVSTPSRDSEAKLLRARARSAVPSLLAVVAALHERHSGRSDRSADFLTLASWFASMPDDGARHRLWRTAFGLTSARHLTTTAETEDAWERARVGPSTPWAQAPGLQVSPQLRKTGSYERRGRQNRVTDRSNAKAVLAARARAESEQTAAARLRILTDGPVRVSTFARLDPEAFRLFLALLGDGLSLLHPGRDAAEVHTSDGGLRLVITRIPDAPPARLRTEHGSLTGPDHQVDISLVGTAQV